MATPIHWPPMNADERGIAGLPVGKRLGRRFRGCQHTGRGVFLEKVYERALLTELRSVAFGCSPGIFFGVYKNYCVGDYFADILVQDALVIELKCVDRLTNQDMAQCVNYLRGPV